MAVVAKEWQARIRQALVEKPDQQTFTWHMDEMPRPLLELFFEFLYDFDPDLPPKPICKAMGPLVGDFMMNDKLNRVDRMTCELSDVVDRLGASTMNLIMLLQDLERRWKR